MGEKVIMFQNGDEGYENICIFAKFRDLKFYYLEDLLIMKFNNATGKKLRTIL